LRWRSQSLATARGEPGLLYEIALEYARMLGPIERLPGKAGTRVREKLRGRFVNDTVAMLREAATDGFTDAKALRSEVLLGPLRGLREFQGIVSDVEFPREPFVGR
jgi:hypothetical protein